MAHTTGKEGAVAKHVYFDFDQTISRIHVFKQLAGWEPGVAPPHSQSERGQIHRLKMLNDAGQYVYSASSGHVVACPPGAPGGGSWTSGALGGLQRVEELRSFFSGLKASGAKVSIITKGNVGACRYLMEHEGLLHFFENVFGMVGQFYGESEYDKANQEPSPLEGTAENELRDSKADLIRSLMAKEGLAESEGVLVEDDPAEIASVAEVCRSVFVSDRKGMTARELDELRKLVGAASTATSKPVGPPPGVPGPPPGNHRCSYILTINKLITK